MQEKVGVIVGRFQVMRLHEGHCDLIEFVKANNSKVIIALGVPGSYPTELDPLSFALRSAMISKQFPDVQVVELGDLPTDTAWSRELDKLIRANADDGVVTLYGSRDSFLPAYSGSYQTEYFEPKCHSNGTEIRSKRAAKLLDSADFLAGIIYREEKRPPISYQTVDMAILNEEGLVLLADKGNRGSGGLYFVGGFVDVADVSLERAIRREVTEEVGSVELCDFQYVGSHRVDDLRYRGTKDGIMTSFFRSQYIFGVVCAQDDIEGLEWVPLTRIMEVLAEEHKPLGEMLLQSVKQLPIRKEKGENENARL